MEPGEGHKVDWRARGRVLGFVIVCLVVFGGAFAWWRGRRNEANDRLIKAIERSDLAGARAALDGGADPNARRAPTGRRGFGLRPDLRVKGASALMVSVGKPVEFTKLLLDRGADVNLICSELGEWDALMYAARSGSAETARALLEKGADVDHRDQIGQCALSLAAGRGEVETVQLLLEFNAQPNAQDLSGMTPLLHALMRAPDDKIAPTMKVLLDRNANPNLGMHGAPPIMLAIQRGLPAPVDELLKHNAESLGVYVGGKTALQLARSNGNPEIIKLLESTKDTQDTKKN